MSSLKYQPLSNAVSEPLNSTPSSHNISKPSSNEDLNKHEKNTGYTKLARTSKELSRHTCSMVFLRIFYYFRYKLFKHTVSQGQRKIYLNGHSIPYFFPPNVVTTLKHNFITFLPHILFDQFKHFQNSFYLLVVLAQIYSRFSVGPLYTYIAPLAFVLFVSILKEAISHFQRYRKDQILNSTLYEVFDRNYSTFVKKKASQICVGDLIQLHTNDRVPCDMILLHATQGGITFVRTDQLDGETDWKLRRAVAHTQSVAVHHIDLMNAWIVVEPPRKDIYEFVGTFYRNSKRDPQNQFEPTLGLAKSSRDLKEKRHDLAIDIYDDFRESVNILAEPLNLENTIWASTTVTSGPVVGLVIYTGVDSRSSMNSSVRRTKTGLFNTELNFISKCMFLILALSSAIFAIFTKNEEYYIVNLIRFILILSSIIPISLRINMDLARIYYGYTISNDRKMTNVVARNTSISEELARIDILLTDKTGTLTQNDMVLKKIHLGSYCYIPDRIDEFKQSIRMVFSDQELPKAKVKELTQIKRIMLGLSLCHTVIPTFVENQSEITFQASSPDEIAMTKFARQVGLDLIQADEHCAKVKLWNGYILEFQMCYQFPFSPETKRMGCIVRSSSPSSSSYLKEDAYKYLLFVKGAEQSVSTYLKLNTWQWLEEECDNFGRLGLRTMVFAFKVLSDEEFSSFQQLYHSAQTSFSRRFEKTNSVINDLFQNLDLIGVTGVEDRLQVDVLPTIEAFRHGGISVWMVTGDKLETATCIALSAGLKSRQQSLSMLTYKKYSNVAAAKMALQSVAALMDETVPLVDGDFVNMAFKHFKDSFIKTLSSCSAAVFARCTPTQKAEIVAAIKQSCKKRVAAIGDGGNDVSMLQKADCGIGIVGKEGNQAAFVSDFSVAEFKQIHRLFFWHGRLSYIRSSKLAQFVIHRGLSIATIQVLFASFNDFHPIATFKGWLTVGYSTYYTMFPVFALVLTRDLSEKVIFMFPELYACLRRSKALTIKKGFTIVYGAVYIFKINYSDTVSMTFTSLILAELLNVAMEFTHWHPLMILSEICSIGIYFLSIFLLPNYFDLAVILTLNFWAKALCLTVLSWLPVFILVVFKKKKRIQYKKIQFFTQKMIFLTSFSTAYTVFINALSIYLFYQRNHKSLHDSFSLDLVFLKHIINGYNQVLSLWIISYICTYSLPSAAYYCGFINFIAHLGLYGGNYTKAFSISLVPENSLVMVYFIISGLAISLQLVANQGIKSWYDYTICTFNYDEKLKSNKSRKKAQDYQILQGFTESTRYEYDPVTNMYLESLKPQTCERKRFVCVKNGKPLRLSLKTNDELGLKLFDTKQFYILLSDFDEKYPF